MDRGVFERMNEIEAKHWWFTARRQVIASMIEPLLRGNSSAEILEAGCGSGGNLSMLNHFGKVDAFEFDDTARQAAEKKSKLKIPFGALPFDVPFGGQQFGISLNAHRQSRAIGPKRFKRHQRRVVIASRDLQQPH